jgi:hypothetical protein
MSNFADYKSHKIVKAAPIHSIGPKTSEDTATVLFVGPDSERRAFPPQRTGNG